MTLVDIADIVVENSKDIFTEEEIRAERFRLLMQLRFWTRHLCEVEVENVGNIRLTDKGIAACATDRKAQLESWDKRGTLNASKRKTNFIKISSYINC